MLEADDREGAAAFAGTPRTRTGRLGPNVHPKVLPLGRTRCLSCSLANVPTYETVAAQRIEVPEPS